MTRLISWTTVGRRISLTTLGLLVGLGIVASMAALAYHHLASLDDMERWVSHTHEVMETSQAMVIAVSDTASTPARLCRDP